MSRKPRGLRPEEAKLWHRVARTATPLEKSAKTQNVSVPIKKPGEAAPPRPEPYIPPAFQIGQAADTALPQYDRQRDDPLRMDKKSFTKMKRGKSTPQARIDLHGMTADAAQTALTSFLLRSHDRGLRLVLVITGKGRDRDTDDPIPQRAGVLRRQLPHWVSIPPLNRIVLQTTQAHQRHGGSGAFYIYLVRRR